ncbi:MAG TPA: hypothetical protein VM658_02845 [bacterium]|nr:hypothetical protein [bacterium]
MLTITRKALALEPEEVMELERIITDDDREEALRFLKKNIYKKLLTSQEDRLKFHLDGDGDPARSFHEKKK